MTHSSFQHQRAITLLEKSMLQQHVLYPSVLELIDYSAFACQQMSHLIDWLQADDGLQPYTYLDYKKICSQIDLTQSEAQFSKALRVTRHQQMLRLILRELTGLSDVTETLRCWSYFADFSIITALKFVREKLSLQYGKPVGEDGLPAYLITIAMGKLGGQELNFSSDVDLIFSFNKHGRTDGPSEIENQQYFTKLVQQFNQIMQQKTADGFVFRIDLRLRPNGDSGALVPSLNSIETYYQEQGRDWERYAMVKARLLNTRTPLKLRRVVEGMITPFVYRRYVDFSVIESLRSMKSLMEREIELNPRLDDMKRGKGGIREIEFIVQSVQIIRGGRTPRLRVQSTLDALVLLKSLKLLDRCDALRQSYLFFRQAENLLQVEGDQQTHTLPNQSEGLAKLAKFLGFSHADEFINQLEQYQRIVSQIFHAVLGKQASFEDDKRVANKQIESLWQGHIESDMATHLLASLSFDEPKRCYHLINDFRQSHRVKRLSQNSRLRLAKLMVIMITVLAQYHHQAAILLRLIHLLENIVGRSAYLALLTENPQAVQALVFCFSKSEFIAQQIGQYPFLLEALLEKEVASNILPTRKVLQQVLYERVRFADNEERKIEIIKQFKLENWLLVARAMLKQAVPVIRVGRFLADVAQVIVNILVNIATEQLSDKYPRMERLASSFAVLSYGKAGSREMSFDSDLDLVFVHNFPRIDEQLAIRLSQRIIHMLTTRSQTGVLYAVDTRLRPSGSAGLLVTHWDAYAQYQQKQAWVWEHQALLKARVFYGSKRYQSRLSRLKQFVIEHYEKDNLATSVREMRQKLGYSKPDTNEIKKQAGGLVDIEFLVQYLVLHSQDKTLARYTHTLSLLKQLTKRGYLSEKQYHVLENAWHIAHKQLQIQSIGLNKKLRVYPYEGVIAIYNKFL